MFAQEVGERLVSADHRTLVEESLRVDRSGHSVHRAKEDSGTFDMRYEPYLYGAEHESTASEFSRFLTAP